MTSKQAQPPIGPWPSRSAAVTRVAAVLVRLLAKHRCRGLLDLGLALLAAKVVLGSGLAAKVVLGSGPMTRKAMV
jgi:hypothetical protein